MIQSSPVHLRNMALVVGFIHGLLFVFLVPPWLHYDEPVHFELAWQLATLDHWPQKGEFDERWRRDLAHSLLQHGFYAWTNYRPDFSSPQPVWIGSSPDALRLKARRYPLYPLLTSLPLRIPFVRELGFDLQNRILRLVSLGLLLITLWVTGKLVETLLGNEHPLSGLVPLFLALLPGFVDVMTAINYDVAAALSGGLFLWASVSLMRRGINGLRLLGVALASVVAVLSKITLWPIVLLLPLVIVVAWVRNSPWGWVPWVGVLILGGVVTVAGLRRDGLAHWYPQGVQVEPLRVVSDRAPWGTHGLCLVVQQGDPGESEGAQLVQWIPSQTMQRLRGKQLTLGGWVWADHPVEIRAPFIRMVYGVDYTPDARIQWLKVGTVPRYFRVIFSLPKEALEGFLILDPSNERLERGEKATVCFDGLALERGEFEKAPRFWASDGTAGRWEGQVFYNAIRNASGEVPWFRVNPLWKQALRHKAPFLGRWLEDVDIFLSSIRDLRTGGSYYHRRVLVPIWVSFWAKYPIGLAGGTAVWLGLGALTLIGGIGTGWALLRYRNRLPWHSVLFLGLVMFIGWLEAVFRGGGLILLPQFHFSSAAWARFAFPVMAPTALSLVAGWWEVLGWLRLSARKRVLTLIFLWGTLNMLSWWAMVDVFQKCCW